MRDAKAGRAELFRRPVQAIHTTIPTGVNPSPGHTAGDSRSTRRPRRPPSCARSVCAILYALNPGDNAQLGTFLGAFQGPEVPGKIQHGSGWWFNDTKTGMIEQMTSLANLGLLGNFIGMLTDSRSFLSYTRHEYFRRIMCNLIGTWVENGEYPADMKTLGEMVQAISSNNAKRYFGV